MLVGRMFVRNSIVDKCASPWISSLLDQRRSLQRITSILVSDAVDSGLQSGFSFISHLYTLHSAILRSRTHESGIKEGELICLLVESGKGDADQSDWLGGRPILLQEPVSRFDDILGQVCSWNRALPGDYLEI